MLPIPFLISIFLAFLTSFLSLPWLIRYLRRIGLIVKDQHKEGFPLVPLSGGISVFIGFMAGIMSFIFFFTFLFPNETWLTSSSLTLLFASILTIFIIMFIGFIDDLLIMKSHIASAGLRQWQKPLLTLTAAIPLMVVNAGTSHLLVPFVGRVEFGLIYPLLLVPLGVLGAANMVNLFAGFNGLESGLGIIYLTSLGSYAYFHGRIIAAIIAFVTLAALLAFYLFNKYPAKILPGDSLTYLLGAVLASIAIIGNLEKATLIVSIPFFLEFFLKLRGRFQKKTVGTLQDGKIVSRYDKVYSLPHFFMRKPRYTERQVVLFMYGLELIFASLIWVV